VRTVAFVPSKLNSERVLRKNVRLLGGSPLVNWVLRTLAQVESVHETYLFASNDEVTRYVEDGVPYVFLERPAYLDTQEATVQDFVGEFVRAVEADVYVLAHITSPFLDPGTVSECVQAVVAGPHDSAFAATEERGFAWFDGRPLNYSLEQPTPRTQDLTPVLFEQSGLYVFERDVFLRRKRRVGVDPFVRIVDRIEGHDIDTEADFAIAEAIVAKGLHVREDR